MSPGWKVTPPKNDAEYFDRMSKTIFTAGLNWRMVENKWPNFRKAFDGFTPAKVAAYSEKQVNALMKDTGIIRNEKKIRATVHNAQQMLMLKKEYGSFKGFVESFGKDEEKLESQIQKTFQHVGPSTARMFLWSVGYPLKPNKEEKSWMKGHHEHM